MLQAILGFLNKLFFFTSYISGKNTYPKPLCPEEEYETLVKMKEGDVEARDKLINHNLRLVAHVAKKYSGSGDFDDLISIGSIGLVKGITSYEFDKSTQLATFLARCIENEILMHLRSAKRYKNTVYLQDPLGIDNEGNEFTLMDILAVKEEGLFEKVEEKIIAQKLDNIMRDTLSDREYSIVIKRFGLNGEKQHTQLQTAEILGISRSYISRIETKAIEKLRSALKKSNFT